MIKCGFIVFAVLVSSSYANAVEFRPVHNELLVSAIGSDYNGTVEPQVRLRVNDKLTTPVGEFLAFSDQRFNPQDAGLTYRGRSIAGWSLFPKSGLFVTGQFFTDQYGLALSPMIGFRYAKPIFDYGWIDATVTPDAKSIFAGVLLGKHFSLFGATWSAEILVSRLQQRGPGLSVWIAEGSIFTPPLLRFGHAALRLRLFAEDKNWQAETAVGGAGISVLFN